MRPRNMERPAGPDGSGVITGDEGRNHRMVRSAGSADADPVEPAEDQSVDLDLETSEIHVAEHLPVAQCRSA